MATVRLNGREAQAHAGKSLFDYADFMRVRLPSSCGRGGQCHECVVEVKEGIEGLNPHTRDEYFLSGGYRLACRALITDPPQDVEFSVLRRQPRILTEGLRRCVDLDTQVRRDGDEVTIGGQPVDSYRGRILGLAVDIGTTTVAMNTVDLESGEIIATSSFENPQEIRGKRRDEPDLLRSRPEPGRTAPRNYLGHKL